MRKYGLTIRELEILPLLGHTVQEIADRLYIEKTTVSAHLRNMFKKTKSRNKTSLLIWALKREAVKIKDIND